MHHRICASPPLLLCFAPLTSPIPPALTVATIKRQFVRLPPTWDPQCPALLSPKDQFSGISKTLWIFPNLLIQHYLTWLQYYSITSGGVRIMRLNVRRLASDVWMNGNTSRCISRDFAQQLGLDVSRHGVENLGALIAAVRWHSFLWKRQLQQLTPHIVIHHLGGGGALTVKT